jgi:outer membrane protein assembly factor BamE (lipoprotein component of BamABCDE complex)
MLHLMFAKNPVYQNDKVVRETVDVALEIRDYNGYSPIFSDGFEQPYRSSPYLVKISSARMSENYSNIFLLDSVNNYEAIYYKLFENIFSKNNLIKIYNKSYKNKINNYLAKHHIKNKFSGNLYYYLFRIECSYIFYKKNKIIFPNANKYEKNIIYIKDANYYMIDTIYSVVPINNKYMNW